MKKCLILCCVLLACLFCAASAFAAGNANVTLSMPEELPAAGETFEVTVAISGNNGFSSFQLELDYDDTVLECTSVTAGTVLDGMLTASNSEEGIISAAGFSNVTADGTLATFTFTVLEQKDCAIDAEITELRSESGEKVDYTLEVPSFAPIAPEEVPEEEIPEELPEELPETPVVNPDVTVPVIPSAPVTSQRFVDVPAGYWAYGAIDQAASLGLITGYNDGTFLPEKNMTRAEFVTMLWRAAGKPASSFVLTFSDMQGYDWAKPQIAWAVENGYVTGGNDGRFCPGDNITREQAMAILYRYSGSPDPVGDLSRFADQTNVTAYARPAMEWAVTSGIINGVNANTLGAKASATRGQLAAIFVRFLSL